MTLKHRVWSSPFSPNGSRLRSTGSTPSLLSLQQDGRLRLLQTPGDLTWPESFVDPQRRSPEAAEEMRGAVTLHKQPSFKCKNVIIYSLTPIIEVNSLSYSTVIEAALICPSGASLHCNTEKSKKHKTCSIPEASALRINDMTSGYSMAFKSKSLPDQQESSSFIHSSCIPNTHLHEAFDSFQSVSRTVNNGAANMMGKEIYLSSIKELPCSLPRP